MVWVHHAIDILWVRGVCPISIGFFWEIPFEVRPVVRSAKSLKVSEAMLEILKGLDLRVDDFIQGRGVLIRGEYIPIAIDLWTNH